MKPALLLILASLTLIASAQTAHAGAWTQPEGSLYAKAWARHMMGGRGFFKDGKILKLDKKFVDTSLNFYGEYGLTDSWTLVGNIEPIGNAKVDEARTAYTGPWRVGVRYGILPGDWKLAVEGHLGFTPAIGNKVLAQGQVQGQTWTYQPTVPGQEIDFEVQVGRGWDWGWISGSFGLRGYTAEGVDLAKYGNFQIGTKVGDVVLDAQLFLHDPAGDITQSNIAGKGQTKYLGVGFGASWWFSNQWGANLGFSGVARAFSNAAAIPITLGIEYKSP